MYLRSAQKGPQTFKHILPRTSQQNLGLSQHLHVYSLHSHSRIRQQKNKSIRMTTAAAAASPKTPVSERGLLSRMLPPISSKVLLESTWSLLRSCFWPAILIYAIKDATAFLLHRFGHRLTNFVAETALGTPISSLTNPWWLYLDSSFLDGNIGYQATIALVFFICLPVNILLNSYALSAVLQVVKRRAEEETKKNKTLAGSLTTCSPNSTSSSSNQEERGTMIQSDIVPSDEERGSAMKGDNINMSTSSVVRDEAGSINGSLAEQGAAMTGSSSKMQESETPNMSASPPKIGIIQRLRMSLSEVLSVTPEVHGMLHRVWWVDIQFNLRALPLQALSLLVVPLFWTLPRLLSLQLAVPVAITEGLQGNAALDRSAQLMKGFRTTYGWLFVALMLGIRIVDMVRTLLLALTPPRFWQEVIEVPLALIALFGAAKLVVIRLQDVLPAAAYGMALTPESECTPTEMNNCEEQQPESALRGNISV